MVFAVIDTALRHLPLEPGKNDLGPVVAKAPADQDPPLLTEQGDSDVGAIALVGRHGAPLIHKLSFAGRIAAATASEPEMTPANSTTGKAGKFLYHALINRALE